VSAIKCPSCEYRNFHASGMCINCGASLSSQAYSDVQDYKKYPLDEWKTLRLVLANKTGVSVDEYTKRREVAALAAVIIQDQGGHVRPTDEDNRFDPPWGKPSEACQKLLRKIEEVATIKDSMAERCIKRLKAAYGLT